MRFALAVTVGAIVQLAVYLQVGTWIGTAALLAIAYILFTSLGVGWFAARRSALAGGLSAALGAAIYGVVSFLGPAAAGMDAFDLLGWEARLLLAVVPYVILGALFGALGGSLRRRVLGTARARR
jgi:hypothetical protein